MSSPRAPSPLSNVHSAPVAIPGGGHHRARSASTSSDSSEGTPPPMTPLNTFGARAPAVGGPGTSPTSPIMSMLAGQTPLKSPTAFPFTKIPFSSAVDDEDAEAPVVRHARRTSINNGSARFVQPLNPSAVLQGSQQERGVNVLRRLSLGGTFGRANAAPEKPPSPPRGRERSPRPVQPAVINSGPPVVAPPSPKRRRGTMPSFDSADPASASGSPPRTRRAPSPMGERILKGHFDSFH